MQAYNASFAKIYNMRWGGFAQQAAPLLRNFYETKPISQANRTVLDLCCGTGQLAVLFPEAGYRVVGMDMSAPMLAFAKENASRFLDSGQARFVQGNAQNFSLDERFGLVVSTFDALNHLEDEAS
jgi:ubiquinone/menaquinone biosynthesis C-methylase UbiE